MSGIASIAFRSIVEEPVKHTSNIIATVTAGEITPDANGELIPLLVQWAPYIIGLIVSCAIFYKTVREIKRVNQEIELNRLQIAKAGRREADK
jgi:hypothetical protein